MSPFQKTEGGNNSWHSMPGDSYIATGVYVRGGRFKPVHCSTWSHCQAINLYRGSRWLVRDGKRYLIERVYN